MPAFLEKLHTHVKTTLQKLKGRSTKFTIGGGGVSTAECEILPCKSGGNPGDLVISSPGMFVFFLLDFPYASNVTGICTKFWGRRRGRTPAIARFVVVYFYWNRPFFG